MSALSPKAARGPGSIHTRLRPSPKASRNTNSAGPLRYQTWPMSVRDWNQHRVSQQLLQELRAAAVEDTGPDGPSSSDRSDDGSGSFKDKLHRLLRRHDLGGNLVLCTVVSVAIYLLILAWTTLSTSVAPPCHVKENPNRLFPCALFLDLNRLLATKEYIAWDAYVKATEFYGPWHPSNVTNLDIYQRDDLQWREWLRLTERGEDWKAISVASAHWLPMNAMSYLDKDAHSMERRGILGCAFTILTTLGNRMPYNFEPGLVWYRRPCESVSHLALRMEVTARHLRELLGRYPRAPARDFLALLQERRALFDREVAKLAAMKEKKSLSLRKIEQHLNWLRVQYIRVSLAEAVVSCRIVGQEEGYQAQQTFLETLEQQEQLWHERALAKTESDESMLHEAELSLQ